MSKADSPKHFDVEFTQDADDDVIAIITFIADREGPDVADAILKKFKAARESLRTLAERGRILPELLDLEVIDYREIILGPYRMIFQVDKHAETVWVHAVLDGRRHLNILLHERLLRTGAVEEEGQP